MKTINDLLNLCLEINKQKGISVNILFFGLDKSLEINVNISSIYEVTGCGNVEIYKRRIPIRIEFTNKIFHELTDLNEQYQANVIEYMAQKIED